MTPEVSRCCATRYPLLLVHGAAVRDGARERTWGRIPEALRAHGAQVYFGRHDAWGTPETNAVQLLERLPEILAESGATKINIIAHSKGGLDARHLLTLLPEDELPLASLTTIATPHQGFRSLDLLFSWVRPAFVPLAFVINGLSRKHGDENPNFTGACEYLTASYMRKRNALQPSLSPLYSQQFASSLHGFYDKVSSFAAYLFIRLAEGPNDGLVPLQSAGYDNFRGELSTRAGRGVAHSLLVDRKRQPFSRLRLPGASRSVEAQFADEARRIPLQVADI
ncbi:MAG: hypothetical protein LBJ48_05455, partial [Coriobacteriales bacterium]|nr:hypothetical protein [Coriobacteriales bacterium]